jgi:hypothetical protein
MAGTYFPGHCAAEVSFEITTQNCCAALCCAAALLCSEVLKYGRYRGFTSLGIVFQTMDNTHLRRALGMKAHQTGVLINRIQPTTSTAKVSWQEC